MFLEQPISVLVVGILSIVGALAALLKTGLVRYLYLAGGFVLATIALLIVEHAVVTPKEEIESTLTQIAGDLESNDLNRVLSHISTASPQMVKQAQRTLMRIKIHRVAVKRNLVVEFSPQDAPLSAHASFNAVILASEQAGTIRNQTSPLFFEVDFEKDDGAWKIVGVKRHPPQEGMNR